jgi:FMN reductase
MDVTVVVGNPKPASRTLQAASLVATRLTGVEPRVLDVVSFGAGLLGWGDATVGAAVKTVQTSDVVVFASPTFKATFTGLLKLFLDQFPTGGLAGVTAYPVMLGAGPGHAMAPEVFLRPVLTELGASCPAKGLYVLDSEWETSATVEAWLDSARPTLPAG